MAKRCLVCRTPKALPTRVYQAGLPAALGGPRFSCVLFAHLEAVPLGPHW